MTELRKLVLDVLKPHQPNALEFASAIAEVGTDYNVRLIVSEVDEKTETVVLTIVGKVINFDEITATIEKMGASVHSIDEVEVDSSS